MKRTERPERHGRRPQQDEQAATENPPGPGARKGEDLDRIRRQVEQQAARSRRHAPDSGPASLEPEEREGEDEDGPA